MTSTQAPAVNVLDPQFYVDPWDAYRWLRDEAPVFWDPVQQLWAVSRYDDVMAIEKDGARYSSFAGSRPHIDQRADRSMINMDDPEHQQQRNLVSRRFNPGGGPRPRGARARDRHRDPRRRRAARRVRGDRGHRVAPARDHDRRPARATRASMWERVRHWSERIMTARGPDHRPTARRTSRTPDSARVIQDFFDVTIPSDRGTAGRSA